MTGVEIGGGYGEGRIREGNANPVTWLGVAINDADGSAVTEGIRGVTGVAAANTSSSSRKRMLYCFCDGTK